MMAKALDRVAMLALAGLLAIAPHGALAAETAPKTALSPFWEELTGPDFLKALKAADGLCILPMGSVEKFGPSGPMGTNLIMARAIAEQAAKREYAVIFPAYYVAQTADVANHQGTISYSADLQFQMLRETVSEMARNGCRKILLSNGHSSNMGLIQWFIQSNMALPQPYQVYAAYPASPRFSPPTPETLQLPAVMQPSHPDADGHGGEERIALLMAVRPDLMHPERGHDEPAEKEGAVPLPVPHGVLIGTARYIEAPTSYIGDASGATAKRGKALLDYATDRLVQILQALKADQRSAKDLQDFAEQRRHPR
jgi:creatinine amidohydrolase